MKTIFRHIYPALLLPLLLLAGCYDDTFDNFRPGEYPEGETVVEMRLDFEPFEAKTIGTRAKPGSTLDRLDDLCLVAYDLDGNLMEGFPIEINKDEHGLDVNLVPRTNSDAANGSNAEDKTWQAKFKLKVPYGRYYIYGVANLGQCDAAGNYVRRTIDELREGGKYYAVVANRETFLAAKAAWDEDNYLNNGGMLGYFTDGKQGSPSTGLHMNDKTVDVNRPGMSLHCWLRRFASKVTIDFDGSALSDKVTIYIRRATIHDIPNSCALGIPNTANATDPKIITYKKDDYRPDENGKGDHIDYGSGTDYNAWPSITNKTPYIMEGSERKQFHSYDSPSLFLYENMQYEGDTDKDINKEQQAGSDGFVIGADDKKDNMPYGSYIEVEAYYERTLLNNEKSKGKLIYRFMLGKDIKKNFEVERNYHYKLTLCPRGYGNDVDWHIEYLEEDNFEYKDPYYVSYLYNHDSTLRFRYHPPEGVTVDSIYAEIVGNNWWPDDPAASYSVEDADTQNPIEESKRDNPMNAAFSRNSYKDAQGITRTRYLGNGFLSLRATDSTVVRQAMTSDFSGEAWETDGFHQSKNQIGKYMNDNYFYGFEPKRNAAKTDWTYKNDSKLIDRSRRTYYFADNHPDASNNGRERYECELMPDGAYMFNLPMFTRAKNLVKASGYTGNNPFEGTTRTAYVRVTVYLSKGAPRQQILRVQQVPRITNPKGIYRRSGNNENFQVTLTERNGDEGATFQALQSDGPWMAEVISNDANFINLNGRSAIKGSDGIVRFNVRFNRMNRDDNVRNAVIRVRYHNYSCVHLIFVRQGYSSQAIEESGTEWHTNNLVYEDIDANGLDPRDEGSLFKFGNLTTPIDANCNVYPSVGVGMYLNWSQFGPRTRYDIAKPNLSYSKDSLTWDDIKHYGSGFTDASGVATMKDFEKLYRNLHVEQGFGVLYADGATTTQMTVPEAYGYCRHDPDSVRGRRGMCGVFVYYWDRDKDSKYNSRNVFFPIGRAGHGHRKAAARDPKGGGTLRYACANRASYYNQSLPYLPWEPLFYDLSRRKGAIYYARRIANDVTNVNGVIEGGAIGLDVNFFSLDFNLITSGNLNAGEDACFLRRVGKQERGKDENEKKAVRKRQPRLRR